MGVTKGNLVNRLFVRTELIDEVTLEQTFNFVKQRVSLQFVL